MTLRSDHLIERAAARLRGASDRLESDASDTPGELPQSEDRLGNPQQPPASVARAVGRAAGLPAIPEPAPELDLETLERAGLVVGRSTRTRISEEFRIAVGRIARTHSTVGTLPRSNVLMITSAKPGEGKSFTALNLAAALAQSASRRIILADVDSKRQSITERIGLHGRRGLLDMAGDAQIDPRSLVVTTEVRGLSVLPTGNTQVDDLAPGNVRVLGDAVDRLATSFPDRLIILDTAPCLSTSEPSTLAAHVGHIVMIVEAEQTQRNELEAALDFVRACPTITILLNKTRLSARHTFGAYDYLGSYQ